MGNFVGTFPSVRKNNFNYVPIGISLMLMIAAYVATIVVGHGFLYSQSHRAVPHGVHAIYIGESRWRSSNNFLFGNHVDCQSLGTGARCSTWIDGKKLEVRTNDWFHTNGAIKSCSAKFDSMHIDCTQAYPTSSYWAHGVRLHDPALEAAFANEPSKFHWQSLLIGMHDGHALQLALMLSVAAATISMWIVPAALRRSQRDARIPGRLGRALLFVPLFGASFVYFAFTLLGLGFWD